MIFRPLPPQENPREIAFIVDATDSSLEICTEHGWSIRRTDTANAESLLYECKGMAIYSLVKPKQLCSFNGFNNWQVMKYHGRVQRCIYQDNISIYPWATFGPDPQQLLPLFDALRDLRVHPASLSTMARNSWLRTLDKPYWVKEWGSENVGKRAFVGGRKETLEAPANYVGAQYLDLSAAYLRAMEAPFPQHLRESEPRWCESGIAEAIIDIPDTEGFGPLPISLSGNARASFQVYGWGKARGFWTIEELKSAIEQGGVSVELLRVWQGNKFCPLFQQWLPWAYNLRTLSGAAGIAAKALTTRLWSMFAVNTERHQRELLTFLDSRGEERVYKPVPFRYSKLSRQAMFIAAMVSSRVRVRLLEELIPHGCVYVDTDGGITPRGMEPPNAGWRTTRIMDRVEIKGSQAYRWHCPECSTSHHPWHYSIAGIPANSQFGPGLFEGSKPDTLWDIGPYSLTVPRGEINDVKRRFADRSPLSTPLDSEAL